MRVFTSILDPDLIAMVAQGAVGVFPTDTLYGLVASAKSPTAVARLYELKHRERKPGTTIAANVNQLRELGLSNGVLKQVEHHWPAPLSIVIPLPDSLEYLHDGMGESPFRVVADKQVGAFLEQTGPLMTSSANQPGEVPAKNIAEAQAYFGDSVDFYVDSGDIGDREPSTIAVLEEDGQLRVVRQGAAYIN